METGKSYVIDLMAAEGAYMEKVQKESSEYLKKTGSRPGVYVLTFGCQQNEADSERLMGLAVLMGYEKVNSPDAANLILVNTCAVREHAEKRALSLIGQFKHLKEKDPSILIGIGGCMVSQEHRAEQIKKSYPYVDFVFGTAELYRLPELMIKRREKGKRLFSSDTSPIVVEGVPSVRTSTYRAYVSIMYGCNNFCTYCIVPYVRGRERSRQREAILAEVKELVSQGYREITLLGQNVNSYGKDREDGYTFPDLLKEIAEIPGDYRIDFMTSHPKDASDRLIEVMAGSSHIAKYFHLPLQAGSDRVLREMNRHYDFMRYRSIVEKIRKEMPDCVITSDIMVGFPGESDADFEMTLEALKAVEFDMIYSFLYSPRKGTPAAAREDQIPEKEKSARFDRLLALQNEIALKKNEAYVGRTVRVLCDGPSKNNESRYTGRTDGNKIVFFEGNKEEIGQFITVQIEKAETFALYGSVKR